jgi:hypothetical protein
LEWLDCYVLYPRNSYVAGAESQDIREWEEAWLNTPCDKFPKPYENPLAEADNFINFVKSLQ